MKQLWFSKISALYSNIIVTQNRHLHYVEHWQKDTVAVHPFVILMYLQCNAPWRNTIKDDTQHSPPHPYRASSILAGSNLHFNRQWQDRLYLHVVYINMQEPTNMQRVNNGFQQNIRTSAWVLKSNKMISST